MYPTAEVRWFRPGPIPRDLENCFRQRGALPQEEEARVDHYLQPCGDGEINVKVREGRLEIKRRVVGVRRVRFTQEAVGLVEHWKKWRFDVQHGNRFDQAGAPASSNWVAVRKVRMLKTYGIRAGEVVLGAGSDDGCEVELTRVVARGQTWWTLAFEAFGAEADLLHSLVAVAKRELAAPYPVRLQAEDSLGYAAWLGGILHEGGNSWLES